jgi:hypothetical protein
VKAAREYVFAETLGLGEGADVTFFRPVRFRVVGKPSADDFLVAAAAWEAMGSPRRIRVTVEPMPTDASV